MPVTQEISFIISISYQSEAAEELVSSGEFRSPHSPYEPAQGSCGLALALLGEDCLSKEGANSVVDLRLYSLSDRHWG